MAATAFNLRSLYRDGIAGRIKHEKARLPEAVPLFCLINSMAMDKGLNRGQRKKG